MLFNRVNKSSQGSLGIDAKSWLGVSTFDFKRSIFAAWLFSQVLPKIRYVLMSNHTHHTQTSRKI